MTANQKRKIEYLNKLLKIYIRLFDKYKQVYIRVVEEKILITYYDLIDPTDGYPFEEIEFPITDLSKRVVHYKNKVNILFKKRKTLCKK